MSFEVKSPKQQVEEAKKESFVKEDDGKATFREMPLMYAGCGAAVAILAFQAINYRRYKKNKMPTSIFVQQTRVYAQGALVALLFVGAVYNVYNHLMKKKSK